MRKRFVLACFLAAIAGVVGYAALAVHAVLIASDDRALPVVPPAYHFEARSSDGALLTDEMGRPLEFDSLLAARSYAKAYAEEDVIAAQTGRR